MFGYDNLDRLTSYTKTPTNKTSILTTVDYDDIGNIKFKSDVGKYEYDGVNGGSQPHALSRVTHDTPFNDPLAEFNVNWDWSGWQQTSAVPTDPNVHADYQIHGKDFVYDANGNITDSGNRKVYWTGSNMPHTIVAQQPNGANWGSVMEYGPQDERVYKQESQFNSLGNVIAVKERTWYVGKDYERIMDKNGNISHRYTITTAVEPSQLNAPMVAGVDEPSYMLMDALGSTNIVLDENGNVAQTLAFDPWGMRTNTGDTTSVNAITNKATQAMKWMMKAD